MSVAGVTARCWILALFIRDDGERFLLGDGMYEFAEKQQHFQANEFANDVVEVQGNDGSLLAGQVRRSTAQAFDGYVGDGTTGREAVEEARRNFFRFFRKNHHYEVVYIFPDGSAIKRQRGYIVDAPEIQEIRQIYPQYHVALGFEDVNYYTYAENDDGSELFGKSVEISISDAVGGGLIWDEVGVVWENLQSVGFRMYGRSRQNSYTGKNLLVTTKRPAQTISGITFTVQDDGSILATGTATDGINYYPNYTGDFYAIAQGTYTLSDGQAGNTSSTTFFTYVDVRINGSGGAQYFSTADNVVTTVLPANSTIRPRIVVRQGQTLDNVVFKLQLEAGSSATSFEPYVGGIPAPNPDYPQAIEVVAGVQSIIADGDSYEIDLGGVELCKIGEFQDYIYKSGSEWYLHKTVAKAVLSGSSGWSKSPYGVNSYRYLLPDIRAIGTEDKIIVMSQQFVGVPFDNRTVAVNNIIYPDPDIGGYGTVGIDIRNTPWATLADFTNWLGSNSITIYYVLTTPTDEQITDSALIEQLDALVGVGDVQSVNATTGNLSATISLEYGDQGGGAEWESGTGGAGNDITVDSLDMVAPVWKVSGPITNPTLEIITTNSSITFNGSLTDGQTLTVDSANMTASVNGVNVLPMISGDWLELRPGVNRLVFSATASEVETSVVEWQEIVG